VLFDTEFFGFAIKHKPFTGNEPNLQHGSRAFEFGLRDAVNEGIAFKYRKSFPFRTNSVDSCARSCARSFDISKLRAEIFALAFI